MWSHGIWLQAEQSIALLLGASSADAKRRLTAEAEAVRSITRGAEHARLEAEAEAAAAARAAAAAARTEEAHLKP